MINYSILVKYLYDVNSQYKRMNNSIKVMYGYMTPKQFVCDTYKDELIKRILFERY